MNVSCPACRSVFRVDPAKVPPAGVRARCGVCGTVIDVGTDAAAPQPVSVHANSAVDAVAAALPAPTVSTIERAGDGAPHEARAPAERAPNAAVPAPAAAERAAAERAAAEPAAAEPGVAEPGAAEARGVPPADARAARPRPVNPYLSNTPELRARRLARALVSDLVAYNPQKREEGLRDGTLRQLFRDEIRKSWDEYVEQVGANVAESTPHFQDALNDVLAGGRRVF